METALVTTTAMKIPMSVPRATQSAWSVMGLETINAQIVKPPTIIRSQRMPVGKPVQADTIRAQMDRMYVKFVKMDVRLVQVVTHV